MTRLAAVRCSLLTVFLILTFSVRSECLNNEVEMDQKNMKFNKDMNAIPKPLLDYGEIHNKKLSSDVLNSKETQDNSLYINEAKKCWNKLCVILDRHRAVRQVQTGHYKSYQRPPAYAQQQINSTLQSDVRKQPDNLFGNYPGFNNFPSTFNPNTTTSRYQTSGPILPVYNSTYTQLPHNNNVSNFSPSFSQSSRHTYPPSPRPLYNQIASSNTPNNSYVSSLNNKTYSHNIKEESNNYLGNHSNSYHGSGLYPRLPKNSNFSFFNSQQYSNPKHTYPPSPRPIDNQSTVNYLTNNNTQSYNQNHMSINSFGNARYPNSLQYYPTYNSTTYSVINPSIPVNPSFGYNNTKQSFQYPKINNTRPNNIFFNATNNYAYTGGKNNTLSRNGFTEPFNGYPHRNNSSITPYPNNLNTTGSFKNSAHANNYNSGQYYSTSNFTQSTLYRPSPTNSYIPQN